ncbi:MAG: NusG domain II-containing protein [bacterium]
MDLNAQTIYRLFTPGDKILIVSLMLISFLSLWLLKYLTGAGEVALISVQGKQRMHKYLQTNEVFTVMGTTGEMTIEITKGSIHVLESSCPQKLCVRQGLIHNIDDIIVCVPNKLTIWIEGKRTNKFDAITG